MLSHSLCFCMREETLTYEIDEDDVTERARITAKAMAHLVNEENLPPDVEVVDVTVRGRSYRTFDGPVEITIVR